MPLILRRAPLGSTMTNLIIWSMTEGGAAAAASDDDTAGASAKDRRVVANVIQEGDWAGMAATGDNAAGSVEDILGVMVVRRANRNAMVKREQLVTGGLVVSRTAGGLACFAPDERSNVVGRGANWSFISGLIWGGWFSRSLLAFFSLLSNSLASELATRIIYT